MTSKPVRRRSRPADLKVLRDGGAAAIAKLFDVGPYDRNQITKSQIDRLRELVDLIGLPEASDRVGVTRDSLLLVCAGFAHRLQAKTAARIRKYLNGGH